MGRILKIIGAITAILLLVLAFALRARYGGGQTYPDLSTDPRLDKQALELAFSYEEPLGNLAVAADGRIFFSVHPESRPSGHKVLEVKNGVASPYPSAQKQDSLFNTVLGMRIDAQNRLWTLDHGQHGFEGARLLAFDLRNDSLVYSHTFSSVLAPKGSFFNDFQVDPKGEYVYIADVNFFGKNPAIVVFDLENKKGRRVLESHASVYPQDYIIQTPRKNMTFLGGLVALKPGVDGITLDQNGEWLYYGAMTHDALFKVKTTNLKDEGLNQHGLAERIIRVGTKPLSDGLSIDSMNNIYITDVEHSGLMIMTPDGNIETLIRDEESIRWADGCSFGPDGYLYFTDSAIPDQMLRSKKHIRNSAPYYIYRIKPKHAGQAGK